MSRKQRLAFSLVEMLIVFAITGVLIGMLLPAVQKAREAVNRAQCANNLRQMGTALYGYHDAYHAFPPAVINPGHIAGAHYADPKYNFYKGTPARVFNHSGFTLLLPYLEEDNLFRQYNFDYPSCNSRQHLTVPGQPPTPPLAGGGIENCPDNANAEVVGTYVKVYHCPSDQMPPVDTLEWYVAVGDYPPDNPWTYDVKTISYTNARRSNYLLNTGGLVFAHYKATPWYVFGINASAQRKDIRDGLQHTIAIGETPQEKFDHPLLWNYFGWGPTTPHWGADHCGSVGGGVVWDDHAFNRIAGHIPWLQDFFALEPGDPNYHRIMPWEFGSKHTSGANFLFADGRVRFLRENIAGTVFQYLVVADDLAVFGSSYSFEDGFDSGE